MPMFTLAISCLTSSNLPWFMDLTFQVPMQYCSLQYQTLLPSPVTSTTGCCFCSLELFLHSSPVAHWAPTDLGILLSVSYLHTVFMGFFTLFSYPSLFILFMGFSRQEYCHSLLQWTPFCQNSSTMTHLTWVALQVMAHGFIELD